MSRAEEKNWSLYHLRCTLKEFGLCESVITEFVVTLRCGSTTSHEIDHLNRLLRNDWPHPVAQEPELTESTNPIARSRFVDRLLSRYLRRVVALVSGKLLCHS